MFSRPCFFAAIAASTCLLSASARADVVWNESTNGNLSGDQSLPTSLSVTTGTNSVIGSIGGGNLQDWLSFSIPQGEQLASLILTAYQSTDKQAFMGFQSGSSFVGNPQTASPYLGYAHIGTGAVNGGLPATDLVGQDLLPIMGNAALAPGAQGFTPPLGPGSYTFLIQQSGAATGYQLDFNVSPIPEPASLFLIVSATATIVTKRPTKWRSISRSAR